jgi:type IV pilus assembly protein PilO
VARGELIDRLGKSPPQVKAAVLLGAALVLGGAYYYLFYADLSDERLALASQRKKLADDERKLMQRKKEYADLLQRKLEVEEELKKNAVKLPSSSELPAFFVHLQTQANAANIRTTDWARRSEIPVETYIKVPVEVEVEGDFYQLLQYFKLLSETPRIITVENLNIKRAEGKGGDGSLLAARFTASTFRQADLPPAQIDEKKPPAKGKAGQGQPQQGGGAQAPGGQGQPAPSGEAKPGAPAPTTGTK